MLNHSLERMAHRRSSPRRRCPRSHSLRPSLALFSCTISPSQPPKRRAPSSPRSTGLAWPAPPRPHHRVSIAGGQLALLHHQPRFGWDGIASTRGTRWCPRFWPSGLTGGDSKPARAPPLGDLTSGSKPRAGPPISDSREFWVHCTRCT